MSDIHQVAGFFGRWGKRFFEGHRIAGYVEAPGTRSQDQAEAAGLKSWSERHHYIREEDFGQPKTVAVLWGPQGSGKTRIAARLAKALKLNTVIEEGLPTLVIRQTHSGQPLHHLSGWREGALYVVQADSLSRLQGILVWPDRVAVYSVDEALLLLSAARSKIDLGKERDALAALKRWHLGHNIDWARAATAARESFARLVEQAKDVAYGDACTPERYEVTATAIQELKDAVYANATTNLTPLMRESLDQICMNIGRIITGHPEHVGSWNSISRYAGLVSARLNNPPSGNK